MQNKTKVALRTLEAITAVTAIALAIGEVAALRVAWILYKASRDIGYES